MADEEVSILRQVLQIDRSDLATQLRLAGSDYEAFRKKVGDAMGDVEKATDRSDSSIKRLERSLGGGGLLSAADRLTKAIVNIGGATKLTDAEQARANATLQKAIEKYKALGQEAPQAMKYVEAATRRVVQPTQDAARAITGVQQSSLLAQRGMSMLTGSVGTFVAGFTIAGLVGAGVREIVSLGKEAVESAGRLSDMSAKTGLSAEMLQRLEFVAGQAGGSLDDFTNASFRLGVRLSSGSAGVNKAVEQLGLNLANLKNASPEQQLMQVVDALAKVGSEQERNRIGVELFGKSYANIASAVAQHMGDIAKQARVMTNAQIAALDELGDRWDKFLADRKAGIKGFFGEIAVGLNRTARITQLEAQGVITEQEQREFMRRLERGERGPNGERLDYLALLENAKRQMDERDKARSGTAGDRAMMEKQPEPTAIAQLKALDAQLAKLTASQRAEIEAMQALGRANTEIEDKFGLTEGAMQRYTATQKKMTEAQRDSAKATEQQRQALEDFQDDFHKFTDKFEALIDQWPGAQPFDASPIAAVSKLMGQGPFASNILGPDPGFVDAAMASNEIGHIDTSGLQRFELLADGTLVRFSEISETLDVIHKAVQQLPDPKVTNTFGLWAEAIDLLASNLDRAGQGTGNLYSSLAGVAAGVAQSFGGGRTPFQQGVAVMNASQVWDAQNNDWRNVTGRERIGAGMMMASALPNIVGFAGRVDQARTQGDSRGGRAAATAAEAYKTFQSFGPAFAGMAAGWGALVGAMSDPAEQGRKHANAFLHDLAGHFDEVATAAQQAEAETMSFQARLSGGHAAAFNKAWILTRDAYLETGQTVERAKKDFDELQEAAKKGPDAVARAMVKINAQLDRQNQLLDARAKKQDMLNAAVQRWGLTAEEAGKGFLSGQLAQQAEQMIEDFQLLTESGANPAVVAQHMAEGVNAFMAQAERAGIEVPESMRPILRALQDQHLLLHANGKAFTDLEFEGIHFGKALEDMFKRVLEKLEALIEKLTAPLPDIPVFHTPSPLGVYTGQTAVARKHEGGYLQRAHSGMFVGAKWMGGGLRHDEVPIIAQSGEGIINRGATSWLGGKPAIDSLNAFRMPQLRDPMASVWAAANAVSRPSFTPVTSMPLATTDTFRDAGGQTFHLSIAPNAIHIEGVSDPRQAADLVIKRLPVAFKHNENGIATSVIRTVRGKV